jgi:glutamate synthase domain-containing protein 1/glutamate synthase domain-containing protein 3
MSVTADLIRSRAWMRECAVPEHNRLQLEAEGGCGVVGLESNTALPGRHILEPLKQMHNRGNGKGGGIAAVGLDAGQMGVPQDVLENDYLVQVAYLDHSVRAELEREYIHPRYQVHVAYQVECNESPEVLSVLPVSPPVVWRYFCRAKPEALAAFVSERRLEGLEARKAEDEFVYQTSFAINRQYYASSKMSAFVMSHGRNMIVMKVVGYAEDVIHYYKLEDLKAHVWIGHQRYPTKGKVWHPGGAHPFMGMDEALVHNGDFANYLSVSEYLAQRNIVPLFLTDTEVSILLFDLLNRGYGYPLEYIIEALAPTTERDFERLPAEKKEAYRAIQRTHVHGSPDGPWFFIIGRNCAYEDRFQLIGITDTSMLRPQVFALVEGKVQIGLIGSEKQAIDAALRSIANEHESVPRQADKYWNARGGSYTDGGAFVFTVANTNGSHRMECTNKFGAPVEFHKTYNEEEDERLAAPITEDGAARPAIIGEASPDQLFGEFRAALPSMSAADARRWFEGTVAQAKGGPAEVAAMLRLLSLVIDRRYPSGRLRASRLREKALEAVNLIARALPRLENGGAAYALVDRQNFGKLAKPRDEEATLVIDARGFPMEGDDTVASVIRNAHPLGWKRMIVVDAHGQRFFGCGLGPGTKGVSIEIFGSSGDYLSSGIAGLEITVHGNGQDQLGQIMASGRLVVHGDVGQTFMYGAKGGEAFVLGNAAGRPLINAVGKPRVVINGTCLDYLAESFMAGDPLNGGGFVVLNGVGFAPDGRMYDLPAPYPGGNLFSLASGGAIYMRDPKGQVTEDQLNGGRFAKLTDRDWSTILPYLQENERLFGVAVKDLLTVDGTQRAPAEVYRKIEAVALSTLGSGNGNGGTGD